MLVAIAIVVVAALAAGYYLGRKDLASKIEAEIVRSEDALKKDTIGYGKVFIDRLRKHL